MLIPFSIIKDKYGIACENVIHVGAHKAEELDKYLENGVKHIVWIEANPELAVDLKGLLTAPENIVLQAVVSDVDGKQCNFNFTTSSQSSSILDLDLHKKFFPNIKIEKTTTVKTVTLKKLFLENDLKMEDYDLVNVDIQGADLLALKGMADSISHMKVIYMEINTEPMYKDGPLLDEVDEYLLGYNFDRVETQLYKHHPWGDAIYINRRK